MPGAVPGNALGRGADPWRNQADTLAIAWIRMYLGSAHTARQVLWKWDKWEILDVTVQSQRCRQQDQCPVSSQLPPLPWQEGNKEAHGYTAGLPRAGCPERAELSSHLITLSGTRSSFLITAMLYCLAKNMTAG